MSRSYSVRIAAFTLGVSPKWLDNVLSHYAVLGVTNGRQGVERGISDVGLRALEMIRVANQEFAIPIPRAVDIANACVVHPEARFVADAGVELVFAIDRIDRRLRGRLLDAIEATPRVRRGRPRKGRATDNH